MSSKKNVIQYEHYFTSGSYDRRYPLPNPRVMAVLGALMQPDGILLDYGCGSGRYLMPLGKQARLAIGFDVCSAALQTVQKRVDGQNTHRYFIAGPAPEDLDNAIACHGPVDLALCLFGVLSHIETPAQRSHTLQTLKAGLSGERSRLAISVPNRRRRFRQEQRRFAGKDQIIYIRDTQAGPLELSYRLYDAQSLQAELEQAGFVVEALIAESILPESVISRFPCLGMLDQWLCRLVPARFGYGLLAIARPAA